MNPWARIVSWVTVPRIMRTARRKRELQQLCQECGISKAKATEIASRYFNEVAK